MRGLKHISFLLLFLSLIVTSLGCVNTQEQEAALRAGRYEGYLNSWVLNLYADGSMNLVFWETPSGMQATSIAGFCDFTTSDPNKPKVIVYSGVLDGKFNLEFVPELNQLNVHLLLPPDNPIVLENGGTVKMIKVENRNQTQSLLSE